MPRPVWKNIIVHHSASNWGTALEIDRWHRIDRKWTSIGYHFVILNGYLTQSDLIHGRKMEIMDGSIEAGRSLNLDQWVEVNEVGAHALGFNKNSIGICLIHKNGKHTARQLLSLLELLRELKKRFNIKTENILGHYEVNSKKPYCPGVDMDVIRRALDYDYSLVLKYLKEGDYDARCQD